MANDNKTVVIQWVLDTRKLWPQATQTSQLRQYAARALELLTPTQREDALRYVHCKDAKMALGSQLLKRYLISRYAGVAWDAAVATRNKDTKPVFLHPDDGSEPLIFNVSHQAGLVVVAAALHPPPGVTLGVDVVCPSERRDRDRQYVRAEGWLAFLEMHADVFCPREVSYLDRLPVADVDARLRYFYTLWCLREAYVKMTGEALLAPWLGVLEMRSFAPPEEEGQLEIYFRGQKLDNVDMHLVNYLELYMIGTSVGRNKDGETLEIGDYELLDIEEVIEFGEKAKAGQVPA